MWRGSEKRYGLDLAGVATSHVMEASLGALWGEDPRYFRKEGEPTMKRLGHVVRMTFLAKNREGRYMPAYARYTAIVGGNFLSNTWRPDSDASTSDAIVRIGFGFGERLAPQYVGRILAQRQERTLPSLTIVGRDGILQVSCTSEP